MQIFARLQLRSASHKLASTTDSAVHGRALTEDNAAPTTSGGTLAGGNAASTNSLGVIKNDSLASMAPMIY